MPPWRLVALALVAVAAGGCGAGRHPHVVNAASLPGSLPGAAPPTTTTSTYTLPASRPSRPAPVTPALLALRGGLNGGLRQAGPASGVEVYDLTRRLQVFAVRNQVKRPPASVEKLWTSIAALQELGPTATFQTTVLGTGHLGRGGVWHGDLYLRGGGDPTFGDGGFNLSQERGYGPTPGQLIQQLKNAGVTQVTGLVYGDGSIFDSRPGGPATGYGPDVPDYYGELGGLTYDHGSTTGSDTPAEFAARQFALTMKAMGVQATAARTAAVAPRGARVLASVDSPPLMVLLQLMDVPSDDLFADMLAEQLGAQYGTAGTITAGAHVISQAIDREYDLHPQIVDGSGLSRGDQSSPQEVVDLLRDIWRTPVGSILWDSLPVVGVSGTTQTIATGTPARGNCVAKTGTLFYVTNLAGYCHSRGGDVVAFAMFMDGPTNGQALVLLGHMVAAIAKY
jgi:serine-type D-Ala-D-Ala carboxypeptidase/endopeptidase (penicillin-binding protein 4)